MDLKFYKHESGVCQKCGADSEVLYKAALSSGDVTKTFVLCKKCASGLKISVEKKNAEETANTQSPAVEPRTAKKFCTKCDAELDEGSVFCGNCGCKIEQEQEKPVQTGVYPGVRKKKTQVNKARTTKNSKSKKIFLIVVLVLLLVGVVIGVVFGVKVFKTLQSMTVYTKNCPFEVVEFGAYEQDNKLTNGKESIEWLVLDEKDGKKLLLSKYALDCRPSDYGDRTYTWRDNSLREWLNNEFYSDAFSESEVSRICHTDVYAEYSESKVASPSSEFAPYVVDENDSVNDDLFLLSISEVQKFFINSDLLSCKATKYAKANSYEINYRKEKDFFVWWWLRNSNNCFVIGESVHNDFSFLDTRNYFNAGYVRPAMWVDFSDYSNINKKDNSVDNYGNSNINSDFSEDIIPSTISVGDSIFFGTYEQNNDYTDGKEKIEWIVLEKNGGKALVISRYGLDSVAYNSSYSSVTWDDSSLRGWLNDIFYNSAFTDSEKEKIIVTNVINSDNREYNTSGGNNTDDRIFALSISEADFYFNSDDERSCLPTEYALSNGASENTYEYLIEIGDSPSVASKYAGHCWWWLRSPGSSSDNAAYIFANGEIGDYGRNVNRNYVCVRPAMWIKVS